MRPTLFVAVLGLTVVAGAVEPPPPSCGASPPYKLAVQVSLNGGSTWLNNDGTLYMQQNRTVSIMVRTLLTVTTGQTQGWSFSLQYDNSNQSYYGGSMSATSVTTTGTQVTTITSGSSLASYPIHLKFTHAAGDPDRGLVHVRRAPVLHRNEKEAQDVDRIWRACTAKSFRFLRRRSDGR